MARTAAARAMPEARRTPSAVPDGARLPGRLTWVNETSAAGYTQILVKGRTEPATRVARSPRPWGTGSKGGAAAPDQPFGDQCLEMAPYPARCQ